MYCHSCLQRLELEDFTFDYKVCDQCQAKQGDWRESCSTCGMLWEKPEQAEVCCGEGTETVQANDKGNGAVSPAAASVAPFKGTGGVSE